MTIGNTDFDKAMNVAAKYQKRLRIPKYFFISVGIICAIATLQKILTGSSFFNHDTYFLIYAVYFSVGILFSIFYILVAGICPYCHQFQINNGKSVGIGENQISYSKGVSPFIDYCGRCGAPLSEKTVRKYFDKSNE